MALPKQKIVIRPETEPKLTKLAQKLLREAGAAEVFPTPLDQLFEFAKVTNVAELPDAGFLATLSSKARSAFVSAKQKLRGIADLRERATYVPRDANGRRERFVRGHELGHQVIPWHNIDSAYLDDAETLSADAKNGFEQEANFFSAELLFQGSSFQKRARDYQPTFDAVFMLADLHDMSRQSTAWRFVEEQDEAIALLQYYRSNAIDDDGQAVLGLWRSVCSPNFSKKYGNAVLPERLRTGNSWLAAKDFGQCCDGTDSIDVDGQMIAFQWQAWWNGKALLVLLRRRPRFHVIGTLLRPD